ncbi:SURF1-like protein [Longimycelium tulufanense]|uniref:SURF1-like protein n=1 Tax=Longimycelium tulufanense TaxID=907463 RepID=A0A8J3CDR0_9PSEU|nr:SURF1 family protein [Longimycelium tulufanense]GGM64364.1 SURF1-like protein [Longimycelium tulufanense]
MRELKVLLKPGWLAMTLLVVAFAVLSFTVLAPWQYHRHEDKKARADAVQTAQATPPAPLDQVLPHGQAPDGGTEWRQVTVTGTYLPEGETLARLRTVLGEAAYEVLTPFRTIDGSVVLVNRGFVRPVQNRGRGNTVPDYTAPPTGQVTLTACLRRDETDTSNRDVLTEGGHRQVYAISSATVGKAVNLDIRPGYLELVADQPGVLGVLPLPDLGLGPHLAYSLQWVAFGVMALLGLGYYAYREVRPARPKVSVHAALAEDEPYEVQPRRGEQVFDRGGDQVSRRADPTTSTTSTSDPAHGL